MLRYENKKTGTLLNIPEEQRIEDVDDWMYIIKMLVYNDKRLIKEKMTNLVNVLSKIKKEN